MFFCLVDGDQDSVDLGAEEGVSAYPPRGTSSHTLVAALKQHGVEVGV